MKKFYTLFFLALLALLTLAARADNININPSGPTFPIQNNVAWGGSGPSGTNNNFTFAPLAPSETVQLWAINNNPSNQHSMTVSISRTGDSMASNFGTASASYVPLLMTCTSTAVSSASQGISPCSLPAPSLGVAIFSAKVTGAALITIQISGTILRAGSPDTGSFLLIQSTNDTSTDMFGSIVTSGVPTVGLFDDGVGFDGSAVNPGAEAIFLNGSYQAPASRVFPYVFVGGPFGSNPADNNCSGAVRCFDLVTAAKVFKTCTASASGNTACWTPSAGATWRLLGYCVDVTANAAQAVAGVVTIDLNDAGTTFGATQSVFVPGAAGTTIAGAEEFCNQNMGVGKTSALAGNVLNVNLSSALTAGVVRVRLWGIEK